MRHIPRSGLIKAFALALALIGVTLFGAPRSAQAAPALVQAGIVAPDNGLTEVRYGHHRHHHHRHFGHRRHFGHHYGYGHRRHFHHRHFGHHRGRHFGRPHFY